MMGPWEPRKSLRGEMKTRCGFISPLTCRYNKRNDQLSSVKMKYFPNCIQKTFQVLLLAYSTNAMAEIVVYIDETEFLNDLAAAGYAVTHEGFEDDAVWGDVRSSIVDGSKSAPEVTSQGIVWTSNFEAGGITTGPGPARTGEYGFYAIPHGSYENPEPGSDCSVPGECGDGWRGRAAKGLIYAIGGWIDTNTPYAKLGLFIGEYPDNPVDFGETCDPPDSENCTGNSTIGTQPEFFGVIDAAGFERFEYRELEGKLEPPFDGDIKLIFADDFYFALGEPDVVFGDGFE